MVLYKCNICKFTSKIKTHYNRHLKTLKHKINQEIKEKETENENQCAQIVGECAQKSAQMCTNVHKNSSNTGITCQFCGKSFKYKQSMLRHTRLYCKEKKIYVDSDEEKIELREIIKKQLRQITKFEKLVEKSNGTINNTHNNDLSTNKTINNIQINNYGEENLEMLTDDFKINCVLHPCLALINIVEKIHFNDDYPENKNIRIVNKRDNKIQIRSNGRWCYHNKDKAIRYTLEDCNDKLEKFYEEKKHHFRKLIRLSCREIIKNVHNLDEELLKQMHNKMELILFNN